MKTKTIITIVLLLFVAASVAYLVMSETGGMDRAPDGGEVSDGPDAPGDAASAESPDAAGTAGKVIAYYFHGDKRCRTCLSIEAYTKEAIESGFPEKLASGDLELRIVNVDEPENEHFIQDYSLATKSVILADFRGGAGERWKNLDMIWEYAGDREVFLDYVRRETEEFIGEPSHE